MPDVIDYGPTIADLERKRDEIDRTIMTLRALAGLPAAEPLQRNGGPSGPVEFTNKHFFGMKAPEAVLLYLESVKEPRGAARIARDLVDHGLTTTSDSPANAIRTTLRRLAAAGQVVQIKTEWALPSWYPGLRQAESRKTAKGSTSKKPRRTPKKHVKRAESPKALKDGSMAGPVKAEHVERAKGGDAYHLFISERRKAGRSLSEANQDWKARNG